MHDTDIYRLAADVIHSLRRRLFQFGAALACTSAVGYYCADAVMQHIFRLVRQVVFISPAEAFVTKIKVALTIGVVLCLPLLFHTILALIRRRSGQLTSRLYFACMLAGTFLFAGGAAFGYFAVIPVGIDFLLGFATLEMQPLLSAGKLVSFVVFLVFMFGLVFELPLVIAMLAYLGLVTAATLKRKRRYAVLIIFVVAAILTPSPDVLSQILLAIPLMVLYEISIILSRICRPAEEQLPEMPPDQQQLFM